MNGTCFFRQSVSTNPALPNPREDYRGAVQHVLRGLTVATAFCLRYSLEDVDGNKNERDVLLQRAEELHARVRGLLMDCPEKGRELEAVTATVRSIEDVSVILQNVATVQRLRKLLAEATEPLSVSTTHRSEVLLGEMLCHTDDLAAGIASALSQGADGNALVPATRAIQGVRACFAEADRATLSLQKRWRTGGDPVSRPFQQIECRCRMIRAALRALLICAESIARIAARQVTVPAQGDSVSAANGMSLRPLPALPRQAVYAV